MPEAIRDQIYGLVAIDNEIISPDYPTYWLDIRSNELLSPRRTEDQNEYGIPIPTLECKAGYFNAESILITESECLEFPDFLGSVWFASASKVQPPKKNFALHSSENKCTL